MRTRLARVSTAAALSIGLLFGAVGQLPAMADTRVTATEGMNVRQGPSTASTIVGSLYRGQTVTVLSSANGWSKINYAGETAYVASAYLTKGASLPAAAQVSAGAVKTTTTAVNLRKGPGLSYGVIRVLAQGSRVTATGKTSVGFTQVVNGSSTGWVSAQYLTGSASGLPAVIGVRVATADLAIRTTSGPDSKTVSEVKKGTKLSVTGATANGRAQIVYDEAIRWVTAKYLANAPATQPAAPALPRVTGTRYATAELTIRSSSADKYTSITTVAVGTKLSITGVVQNGRMQVVYNRAVRWVTAKYLATSKPATPPPSGSAKVERGLQPNAKKTYRAAIANFPQIKTVYGVRPDPIPDHPSGRAIDLMIPNYKSASGRKLGSEVAAWAKTNARSLGVSYIIWDQRIWNIQRDGEGWRYMANRGGDSANHKDHVHITVYGGSAP